MGLYLGRNKWNDPISCFWPYRNTPMRNIFISRDTQSKTFVSVSFSDVVVQIVDARNPLLFRCPDLVRTFLLENVYQWKEITSFTFTCPTFYYQWPSFDLHNLIQEMNELNISLFSGLMVCLSCCACRSYMWRKCRGTRWTCCWWTRQICWPGSRGERGPNTLRKTGWGPCSGRPWLRATGWKQRRRWGDGDSMSVNALMVNVWNLKWFLNKSVWRVIIT